MSKINELVLDKFENFIPIVEVIAGSRLYGTNTEESDTDIRGVFIPSKKYFLGFANNVEQIESKRSDVVFFDIRKFFKLCLDCNPNIVELLFIPKDKLIFTSQIWERIVENRNLFLSKKARYTFSGYAVSQLHRIKQHRNWLLHPVKKQPLRVDFGLPMNESLVTKDQMNAYDELKANYNLKFELNPNFLELLEHEKAFINANRDWNNYEKWKKERNPARAKLEEKFGFDVKHGAHLCRLLSEGKELLLTGNITFPRPDKDFLLEIISGKYFYDDLMEIVGDLDSKFDKFYEQSILPHSPNQNKADELCISIVSENLL